MEGRTFHGRYLALKPLGKGSFGTAWLVEDEREDRTKKVMKQIFVGMMDPGETIGALAEAKLLERLNHPNIIFFFDAFLQNQCVFIVTEYCEGGDLHQVIERTKESGELLPEAQILAWLAQLGMALEYMHSRSVRLDVLFSWLPTLPFLSSWTLQGGRAGGRGGGLC
eukprot:m.151612 g.151612  ORF g.151612 m.151612 type:complete len:167 (+) comp10154_c0_seq1:64-564(+)